MSAGLTASDSMFSVRITPWHGLGAVLDRSPASIAEAIEAAGLDWSVVKKPLAIDQGSDLPDVLRYKKFPGYYATVRQDTDDELGVVGEDSARKDKTATASVVSQRTCVAATHKHPPSRTPNTRP